MAEVESNIPWVEKYRPNRIDDISHQDNVKKVFKQVLKTHEMPHLLLHGPPGTGKTTAILALCQELFGSNYRSRVKELNASDDRGIKVVQGTIKQFAQLLPYSLPEGSAPFKILILDEADMMTRDAQTCLRMVMEEHCVNTRFVLICNYISNIIPPIISRCASFRFEPVQKQAQFDRLNFVCQQENIVIEDNAKRLLLETSAGDMRCVLNILQCTSAFGTLTEAKMAEALGIPSSAIVDSFLQRSLHAMDETEIHEWVNSVHSEGWDVMKIIQKLCSTITHMSEFNDLQKAILVQQLSEIHCATREGCNEYISLLNVGLELYNLRNK